MIRKHRKGSTIFNSSSIEALPYVPSSPYLFACPSDTHSTPQPFPLSSPKSQINSITNVKDGQGIWNKKSTLVRLKVFGIQALP